MFAVDVKRRLAGDNDFEFRADGEQLRDHGSGGDQMLEVIEQQKHRLAQSAHVLFQAFLRRLIAGFAQSQRLRDRGGDQTSDR